MTNRQTILFDLDDTLVHCNKYFDFVIDQFSDLMEMWFHTYSIKKQAFIDKQLEIDLAGVQIHGFAAERFPLSFVETYEFFSAITGRHRLPEERERLMDLGRSVYAIKIERYPNMYEVLDQLRREGHKLVLYTGGEEAIQLNKIKMAEIEEFFGRNVFVVQHKTTKAMETVLSVNGYDRESTWMIGNSVRTDINPALEAGINAIFIPVANEWAFNVVDVAEHKEGQLYTAGSLIEVPDIIRDHSKK